MNEFSIWLKKELPFNKRYTTFIRYSRIFELCFRRQSVRDMCCKINWTIIFNIFCRWRTTSPSLNFLASETPPELTFLSSRMPESKDSSPLKECSTCWKSQEQAALDSPTLSQLWTPQTVLLVRLSRMGRSDAFPRHWPKPLLGLRRRNHLSARTNPPS
jgi:hypothetical protein